MCIHCAEKDAYIAELERALDGAIWVRSDEVIKIRNAFDISTQKAELIYLLYEARANFLTPSDIENALTHYARKPLNEYRRTQLARQVVLYTRRALGEDFILTDRRGGWDARGYRLSDDARRRVAEVLA